MASLAIIWIYWPDTVHFFVLEGLTRFGFMMAALALQGLAQAALASFLGDKTARAHGLLGWRFLGRFEALSLLFAFLYSCCIGYGVAWGASVPVDASRLKGGRAGTGLVALSGLLANAGAALLAAGALYAVKDVGHGLESAARHWIMANATLALFSCLPLYPLAGRTMLGAFLPASWARRWDFISLHWGERPLCLLVALELAWPWKGPLGLYFSECSVLLASALDRLG